VAFFVYLDEIVRKFKNICDCNMRYISKPENRWISNLDLDKKNKLHAVLSNCMPKICIKKILIKDYDKF
jgi:hypothetical protein